MVDRITTRLSEATENTARVNPNINSGLWMIMTRQYRFIHYNKCTVGDVDGRDAMHGGGAGGVWELSVPSVQVCRAPRTVLNNKAY